MHFLIISCTLQGLPVQQETCNGGLQTAGRSVSGHKSQVGGSEAPSEGETGPTGFQRTSHRSEDGRRHRFTFIHHKQCMFSFPLSLLGFSSINSRNYLIVCSVFSWWSLVQVYKETVLYVNMNTFHMPDSSIRYYGDGPWFEENNFYDTEIKLKVPH